MLNGIHHEEARSTDHGKSIQELIDIAPPCQTCGEAKAIDERKQCEGRTLTSQSRLPHDELFIITSTPVPILKHRTL